jgi:hypothetical protein
MTPLVRKRVVCDLQIARVHLLAQPGLPQPHAPVNHPASTFFFTNRITRPSVVVNRAEAAMTTTMMRLR